MVFISARIYYELCKNSLRCFQEGVHTNWLTKNVTEVRTKTISLTHNACYRKNMHRKVLHYEFELQKGISRSNPPEIQKSFSQAKSSHSGWILCHLRISQKTCRSSAEGVHPVSLTQKEQTGQIINIFHIGLLISYILELKMHLHFIYISYLEK